MKLIRRMALSGLLAISMTTLALSQTDDRSAEGASFAGKVSSMDKTAQTVVVDGKTFQLLQTSQITRQQQPANVNDLAIGDRVAGKYKRSTADKMEVLRLDIVEKNTEVTAATPVTDGQGATFSGRVSKVDSAAQTVTIGSRTYQVLPTSQITRNGGPATFNDLRSGSQLSGRYKVSDSGKMEILTMEMGGTAANQAVGAASDAGTTGAGATFSGKIGKVNRQAQTIKVDGQTYHILPTTTITRVDGAAMNLGNLKEDQRVTGTFKRADNGTLELLSLQVGRQNNK
jgi:ribosomal protein S1